MNRRLLAILIALIGSAGVVVVGLATFVPEEDRSTFTPAGPVRGVEVDVAVGRVSVVTGPGADVKVDRTRRYLYGVPETEETMVDGVLRITADCRRILTFGCEVDYRLEVPVGAFVRIRTGSGGVSVAGVTGLVEVDTGAGGVRLTATKGPVRVGTSSGDVDGVDLSAAYLDATTGAGRIRLSMAVAPGRLGLRSGAGRIEVGLPAAEGGYRVDAEAGAGKVDVGVAQNPGASRTVIARSGAGSIRIFSP